MHLAIQFFDDCPNYRQALHALDELRQELGIDDPVEMINVGTDDQAHQLGFRGSPTILIDGVDPFFEASAPTGLSCRLYRSGAGYTGLPPREGLKAALVRSMTSAPG